MLKLTVGVGLRASGSAGALCRIELECDQRLLEQAPEEFQAQVRAAYAAARRAVEDELARHPCPSSAGLTDPAARGPSLPPKGPIADKPTPSAPDPRRTGPARGPDAGSWSGPARSHRRLTRPRQPASPQQVRALHALARAGGVDLEDLLHDEYGVGRPEELTPAQARQLIDRLQAAADI